MKHGLLIATAFLISVALIQPAFALKKATNLDGEFYAFRFAQLMNRANTPAELAQRLPLGKKDAGLLKTQFQKDGPSTAPVAKQIDQTVVNVEAMGHAVSINFAEIVEHRIFVNGHVVEITPTKNFLNYHSEVVQILKDEARGKSAALFFLPQAHAAEATSWYSAAGSWIAGTIVGTVDGAINRAASTTPEKMITPLVQRRLAIDIIHTYNADEDLYQSGVYGPVVDQYAPLVFRCENGALQRMGRMSGTDAQNHVVIKEGLKRTSPTTFSFATFQRSPDAQLDQNFNVVKPGGRLARGQNLLTADDDYGRFPVIAQECCAMKGCYEQVIAGIQPELKHSARALKANPTAQ